MNIFHFSIRCSRYDSLFWPRTSCLLQISSFTEEERKRILQPIFLKKVQKDSELYLQSGPESCEKTVSISFGDFLSIMQSHYTGEYEQVSVDYDSLPSNENFNQPQNRYLLHVAPENFTPYYRRNSHNFLTFSKELMRRNIQYVRFFRSPSLGFNFPLLPTP